MINNRELARLIIYAIRYDAYVGRELLEKEINFIEKVAGREVTAAEYYLDIHRPEGDFSEKAIAGSV